MGRAFSALAACRFVTQACGLGWYKTGLWP